MSVHLVYYPGGEIPTAPQRNRAQLWDGATATYTEWALDGTVITTRPLTADEVAGLASLDTAATGDSNKATLQQQAATALASNRAFIAATKPSTAAAQASAAYDQAVTYGRQLNGVIRLLLNQLDATN